MYQIDNQSRTPVYEQIISQVERYILTGILKSGDKLISVRSMSMQLHLNPNTVQKAYQDLERKGEIYSTAGVGSFISENALEILKNDKREMLKSLVPTIKELRLSGVKEEEICELVNSIYKEEIK